LPLILPDFSIVERNVKPSNTNQRCTNVNKRIAACNAFNL
jgi:hypothetical protein